MDKLNYFSQPLVQSFLLFPIIVPLKGVAWAMIEEEKNTSPSSLFKKKSDLGFQMNSCMYKKHFLWNASCLPFLFILFDGRVGVVKK